ncbi:hypothetical protein [Desulfosediminicola ganghwensis]|uniref:hypothetical protein n=1 Tax=Desulfosediminicola ganghwensis TaxID=2569540 RepID=UPI0010AD687C|nr:hypothetical protein [Desulfosediminicola ganghwensis]
MKKALILTTLLFAAIISGSLWRSLRHEPGLSKHTLSPEMIEAQLIEGFTVTATSINEIAPLTVDEYTRLDGATVGPGARITYRYTLTEFASKEVDPDIIASELIPAVKENACNNEQIKATLLYGGVYIYEYFGKDDIQIGSFQIDKQVCK